MKKVKSIWKYVLVMVLSVAMMLGGLSTVAFAEPGNANAQILHESGYIPAKVVLGTSLTLPEPANDFELKVQDPSGAMVQSSNEFEQNFVLDCLGNYIVTYFNDEVSYDYTIYCYEEKEYFVYVENGGATIPSSATRSDSFTLPDFYLATTDDDGNTVNAEDEDKETACWAVLGGNSERTYAPGETIALAQLGVNDLTLIAKFQNSNKLYKANYTINVLSTFTDTEAPVIETLVNVPSSANINEKVTLPVASASDNYDENVEIRVVVRDPAGNPVKQATVINDHGYSVEFGTQDAKFDNDKNMAFYPGVLGNYVVTYTAFDDKGNESATHEYIINCVDKLAPVIVDIDEAKIPTVWGLEKVTDIEGNVKTHFNLPVPEVADNYSEENAIKLTLTITNPSSVVVAKFNNITYETLKTSEGATIAESNATYGKYIAAGKTLSLTYDNGLNLSFSDFSASSEGDKVNVARTGDWTISYEVRDGNSNGGYGTARRTYTIKVNSKNFEDIEAPKVDALTLPGYVILGRQSDKTYTVPTVVASDDNDGRITEEYYIISNGRRLSVKSGEVLDVENDNEEVVFVNEDEERLVVGNTIEFEYAARDDAGNSTRLLKDEENYSLPILFASAEVTYFDVSALSVNFAADSEIQAGTTDKQVLGSFSIGSIQQKEFVGFEIAVQDEDGNYLDNVSAYTFMTGLSGASTPDDPTGEQHVASNVTLYVKDIAFNPSKSGKYTLFVRLFDAVDNSYMIAKTFNAVGEDDPIELDAASAWISSGSISETYYLQRKSYKFTPDGEEHVRVFGITGGRYSLLGDAFTPIAQGDYTITEYDATRNNAVNRSFEFGNASWLTKITSYGMTAAAEETTRFEVYGEIKSYYGDTTSEPTTEGVYEEGAYIVLDPIVAYSQFRNYEVSMTVTDNDSNTVNAYRLYQRIDDDDSEPVYAFENERTGEKDENGNDIRVKDDERYTFTGRFAFSASNDGQYTIKVTANKATETYTIKVGDIVPPQFNLDTTATKAVVGDKFSFRVIDDLEGEIESEITVYYKLFDANNNEIEIAGHNRSLSYNAYKALIKDGVIETDYTFDKSGDYRVVYELSDNNGNTSTHKYTITVSSASSNTPTSLTLLSTVLIIVGVLLIAGVIIALYRFRKVRK